MLQFMNTYPNFLLDRVQTSLAPPSLNQIILRP